MRCLDKDVFWPMKDLLLQLPPSDLNSYIYFKSILWILLIIIFTMSFDLSGQLTNINFYISQSFLLLTIVRSYLLIIFVVFL